MEAVLGHWASEVRERLGNVRNEPARVALLWRLLRNRLTRSETPDAAVQHSVQLIESARGQGPIENFMPSGVGERQWQRRFLQSSGFSPKAFARITRLQYLIRLFESGPIGSWADLAIEAGFYDQSHLVNEFRSFSGQSPEAYFQAQRGMAEFYHDGNFQDNIRERE